LSACSIDSAVSDALELRPAADRLDAVESLLADAGLPTEDVRAKPDCFRVAVVDGTTVGVGGVEPLGTDGLLRSVVVSPAERGRGYGTALVAALEDDAREQGIETLYLLTTTAAEFFAGLGYERIDRESVPVRVRTTTQFAQLCPASATAMRTEL
jgi:amino-acid N-acetyltransferase